MTERWIVTGGSRGLGLAIARWARRRGHRVAVVARGVDEPALRSQLGSPSLAIAADVTVPESVKAAFDQVAAAWGGIDVLVNNAGLHRGGKADKLDLDDWDAVLRTNLTGPLHCVRAALPHMGKGGSIVNIGAVVGFRGFPGDSPYGASKAGLAGLTRVLAVELARQDIRVNLVVPGLVKTDMTEGLSGRAMDSIMKRIPMRRLGHDDEVAEVVGWVAGSTYMTGAIIPTDGGLSAML
ncbi:MAG TPA: SDR family oxidoreductase [Steroidobacteraceae bacterium]|nr:SDR family oxidoreductase [Steroidobacteraceae bacterium]